VAVVGLVLWKSCYLIWFYQNTNVYSHVHLYVIAQMENFVPEYCKSDIFPRHSNVSLFSASYTVYQMFFFWRWPSRCVSSTIYCINTVNTQHIQRPDVLVQLGYIWRHVSAVKRPSSGQQMCSQSSKIHPPIQYYSLLLFLISWRCFSYFIHIGGHMILRPVLSVA